MPTTSNKGYSVQTVGSNSGVWGAGASTALNEGVFEIMDLNMGGVVTKALTNVNVTLSASESRNLVVRCTGTLTGAVQITTACVGFFVVENRTTGAFALTIYNGVGSAIECPQGYAVLIIADATNGCRLANDNPGEVFVASGASASEGLVPDPGATAGTGRYLREDATFVVPPFQWTPSGRLTLTTGTPVTTSDVTGATTVYYTAMNGNTVPVYGSCLSAPTSFAPVTITGGELSMSLSNPNHAANTNYDVFIFLDSSTVRIGTGPPWTSATARGTGAGTTQISLASGLWTNTVAMTARNGASTYSVAAGGGTYLGTIRTGSTAGTTDDSKTNRFVFNAYNQMSRALARAETTSSWTYSTSTWRQANGSTSNQVNAVIGIAGSRVSIAVACTASMNTGSALSYVGVGVNSTSANSANTTLGIAVNGNYATATAYYSAAPGIGYYSFAWLEYGSVSVSGTTTWVGTTAGTAQNASGIVGDVWA